MSGDPSPFNTAHGSTYAAYGVGRGMYVFDANFTTSFGRKAINSNLNGGFVDPLEPRDICIANSGRIFVCSYSNSNTSSVAVWELSSDYTTWTNIIQKSDLKNGTTDYRVVSMDVKGEQDDLTLLLLCAPKNSNTNLVCYEYRLSTRVKTQINLPNEIKTVKYYNDGINAHAKIAYGENDLIWCSFGKDDGNNNSNGSIVMVCDRSGNLKLNRTYGAYYGGEALLITGNLLIKSYNNSSSTNSIISFKRVDYTNNTLSLKDNYFSSVGEITDPNNYLQYYVDANLPKSYKNLAYNDFAIDYANNVYVASNWSAQIFPISLPYDGIRETPAPDGMTFTLADPVPNILATDLCCTPHETKPKYIFSFNVNTKPEGAEIRFYITEQDMLNDSKQNAAYSDYDNHDNCAYYYRFSSPELKQGRMSVELDILGHEGDKELADKKLPSGKLYWNVFLKTRRSLAFSPIYVQPLDGEDLHYRLHATIDNNPDNDSFGHIYAIDYKRDNANTNNTTDDGMDQNPCKLMIYTIGGENIDDNDQDEIKSDSRYTLIKSLTTEEMVQPRRPAVAPDGMVYLTDYGDYDNVNQTYTNGPASFVHGGIWIFNPNDPLKAQSATEAKLGRFYDDSETASDVCFYGIGTSLKLFKTNTYEEINHHGADYSNSNWANNGCRIYSVGNADNTIRHKSDNCTDNNKAGLIKFLGDANGNMSIRATNDGIWVCQHRSGTVTASYKPDNAETTALMFYNNNGEQKFQSYKYDGGNLSQTTTSIMQSTPGAGMTISPDEKYLYVVNHEGNILEFEIGGAANTGKTLTLKNTFINSTDYKCISSMNFDYAGNLVVTTDQSYPANASEKTQIVVFTMPYNRDNARSIPASKAQREIPERLSQDLDNSTTLAKEGTYDVELYRPLQGATFNTICLPFEVDLTTLPAAHKLYGATVMDFTSVTTPSVGNETVLSLNFTKVDKMLAGKPYIIYVEDHVRGLIEFSQVTRKNTVVPQSVVWNVQNSSITYTGVFNPTEIEEGKTILVDQNRLANVTNEGTLFGFRGYFTIPESLRSLKAMISTRHDTPTGLEELNITERTYQKFLREGRVYIRVGEALYTITGEKVE